MDGPGALELAKHTLLVFGVVLGVGTLASLAARYLRVPDVVVFLLAGLLLGPFAFGLVDIRADSMVNQLILIFGASYILFDGGASVRFRVLREVWITVLVLATLGVLVTAGVTAVAAQQFLGLPIGPAILLGAVVASTDPATLVPVLRQVRIRPRVAQTVMTESAFNDAMGAILTFTVLGVLMGTSQFSLPAVGGSLAIQLGLGLLIGIAFGYGAAFVISDERFGLLADYARFVTLIAVIGAYMAADGLGSSGFMAVFVFGMILGNQDQLGFRRVDSNEAVLEDFVMTTAVVMRMFIFILLGSQVDLGLVGQHFLGGILVVAVLMFVARPLTVVVSCWPDRRARWSRNELLFMCWTRETGVIPGALAGLLVGLGAPEARVIAAVTFIAVLVTILVQATTTRWLARRLDLLDDSVGVPSATAATAVTVEAAGFQGR